MSEKCCLNCVTWIISSLWVKNFDAKKHYTFSKLSNSTNFQYISIPKGFYMMTPLQKNANNRSNLYFTLKKSFFVEITTLNVTK